MKCRIENSRNQKAREGFEITLKNFINDYNASVYTNKFIVGDGVEILFSVLVKAVGLIYNVSDEERTDLYIQIPKKMLNSP